MLVKEYEDGSQDGFPTEYKFFKEFESFTGVE